MLTGTFPSMRRMHCLTEDILMKSFIMVSKSSCHLQPFVLATGLCFNVYRNGHTLP